MKSRKIIRLFLFAVFFSVGLAAMSLSIRTDELLDYYRDKQFLKQAKSNRDRLKTLNDDYGAVLEQLKQNPELIEKLAPAVLGTEPADSNDTTVYPKADTGKLAAIRKILDENVNADSNTPAIPDWLGRSSDPRRRIILFLAGASLILISFVCFGSIRQLPNNITD